MASSRANVEKSPSDHWLIPVAAAVAMVVILHQTPARGGPENLLTNPGFEQIQGGDAVGWEPEAGKVEYHREAAHAGESGVTLNDSSARSNIHLMSEPIPARPGGQYTATAWFRTHDDCRPGLYINFFDDLNQRIHHRYARAEPAEQWQQITVTTAAPRGAVTVRCSLYAFVSDVGRFDADDVHLQVTGGQPPHTAGPHAEPGDKDMVDIGSRRELFVDSFLLDDIDGDGRRLLHHPVRREIALKTNKPWEGTTAAYAAVVEDGDTVRLYYRGDGCTCLAESEDGVHFTRPNLGLYEWEGSTDNNIVYKGPGIHNFTPFKDPNPDAPDDQRYKAVARTKVDDESGLTVFVSSDGIHWEILAKNVITKGAFDSQNLIFWDPLREKYVDFHRGFRNGFRDIMTCTSEDFVNWTEPEWLDYGDTPPEHLYTNAIVPYYRAPHIYLGFPNRFVPARTKVEEHGNNGVNDAVFMSSRDGINFERWEEGWLRPSTDPKTWTDRNNYVQWGMVQTSDSEISMYCNEHYRYPTQRFRRLTMRVDGFVSLYAEPDGAEAITRPLTFSGDRLTINYETSAAGTVRMALCDEKGEAYEGFGLADCPPIFGNEISHVVEWQDGADVRSLAGKPVRMRIRMQDADLYSFQFSPADTVED